MWRIRSTVDWPVSHQDRFVARTAQGPRHACLTRKCIVREQKIKLCRWRVFLFVHVGNKNLNRRELPVDLTVFPNMLHPKNQSRSQITKVLTDESCSIGSV